MPVLLFTKENIQDPIRPKKMIKQSKVILAAGDAPSAICVLDSGRMPGLFNNRTLERYGVFLNNLKALAIGPGTHVIINYSMVNTRLGDHDKGLNNMGYEVSYVNPVMAAPKMGLLGLAAANILGTNRNVNTDCLFVSCDDIVKLSFGNKSLYVNHILIEPLQVEHFAQMQSHRYNEYMYYLVVLVILGTIVYLLYAKW
jgi:hypothetical protein